MEQDNKIMLLLLFVIVLSLSGFSQNSKKQYYIIGDIDSTSLAYYYWLKIKPIEKDTILNLLSSKKYINETCKCEIVKKNKKYLLSLEPLYSFVKKHNGLDSVWVSVATMRTVEINNEIIMTSNGLIHPFKSKNLIGLMLIE